MKKSLLVAILSIGLIFTLVSNSNARFNFGIKFFQYNTEYTISDIGDVETYRPPQIAFHLGASTGGQTIIFGGVELSRVSFEEEESNYYDHKTETSITVFSPSFGGKFYFTPMSSGEVCFYFSGTVFKSFALVNYDTDNLISDKMAEEYLKEFNSPFGFMPAFGAEYFFTDNFSLGGETGLKFAFVKADVEEDHSYKYVTKGSYIDHYIAVTLNFFID